MQPKKILQKYPEWRGLELKESASEYAERAESKPVLLRAKEALKLGIGDRLERWMVVNKKTAGETPKELLEYLEELKRLEPKVQEILGDIFHIGSKCMLIRHGKLEKGWMLEAVTEDGRVCLSSVNGLRGIEVATMKPVKFLEEQIRAQSAFAEELQKDRTTLISDITQIEQEKREIQKQIDRLKKL